MNKILKKTTLSLLISGVCMLSATAYAQTASEVAKLAIDTNPEVQANWHAFMASGHDIGIVSGGYRPTVDFLAGYGREWRDDNAGGSRSYNAGAAEITLTQMLFDGFRTRSEVKRFESAQLVRYFELLETVEGTALQAIIAYQDVMRFRELLSLAEENLEQHISVFDQIQESARAGVARGADLEQINGRLSLAEANLITEISNLHDVSARYLRIVGELPPASLAPTNLSSTMLPADIREAIQLAYEGSPTFHATLRNIEASKAGVESRRSFMRPELNLVAGVGVTDNADGISGTREDARIGLQLRYNLYRGGSDSAALNKSLQEVNLAKDQRDTACVNVRQTVQIAYNDTRKLNEQLPILNQHKISSDRVRVAYKNQFDIGERTLLDVLDSENEYFQASRAYSNALYDREIAVARTLATMGQLLPALEIVREGLPSLSDLNADEMVVDAESACPAYDVNESLARTGLR